LQHPDCPPNKKAEILREIGIIEGEARAQSINNSIFPSQNDLG